MEKLHFTYRDSRGEQSERRIEQWNEEGYYVIGFCESAGAIRTFRKDRILEYFNGCESALSNPFPGPPPKLQTTQSTSAPSDKAFEILFTGFATLKRAELEEAALTAGLHVCASVTKGLMFLCGGPNAGPAKLAQARSQFVYILDELQFLTMLETGELPA